MNKAKEIIQPGDLITYNLTYSLVGGRSIVAGVEESKLFFWVLDSGQVTERSFSEIKIDKVYRNGKLIWPKPLHELWMVLSNSNSNYGEYSERDSAEERLAFCKRRFSDTEFRIVHMREVRE